VVCTETAAEACFTRRTVPLDAIEVIGGSEMYRAASRASFFHAAATGAGAIHLTLGPVRAGPTAELVRVLNRHRIGGRRVLLIRPPGAQAPVAVAVATRAEVTLPPPAELRGIDVVGVGDAQAFAGLAAWAEELANGGKIVEVSALDSDCAREPYANVVELFPRCESVRKLDFVCPITGLPAPFSTFVGGISVVAVSRWGLLEVLA